MCGFVIANWGLLTPTLFTGAKTGRMAFYEAHRKDLDYLFDDTHWRNYMTPEHIEMRRSSANRSADWIPNEIYQRRDKLVGQWMEYIFEPGTFDGENPAPFRWGDADVCLCCGIGQKEIGEKVTSLATDTSWTLASLRFGWCNFCWPEKMKDIKGSITAMQLTEAIA